MKKILSLDFDGVCHSYTTKWQGPEIIPDSPVEGMTEFITKAVKVFDVQIYSTRSKTQEGRYAMKTWFSRYLSRDVADALKYPVDKPPAFVSIDDRAVCFRGIWPSMDQLSNFKPWNKQPDSTRLIGEMNISGIQQAAKLITSTIHEEAVNRDVSIDSQTITDYVAAVIVSLLV